MHVQYHSVIKDYPKLEENFLVRLSGDLILSESFLVVDCPDAAVLRTSVVVMQAAIWSGFVHMSPATPTVANNQQQRTISVCIKF